MTEKPSKCYLRDLAVLRRMRRRLMEDKDGGLVVSLACGERLKFTVDLVPQYAIPHINLLIGLHADLIRSCGVEIPSERR